ncbi:MAG: 3-oxoacyl-ACP reductase [Micrococcaceae bacterium]
MPTPVTAPVPADSADQFLREKIVVVTGGARGLGRHLTEAFLGAGAKVVIGYLRSQDAAEEIVASHPDHAVAVRADVREKDQVAELIAAARERFGAPVNVVVNNALVDFSFNGDARPTVEEITAADFTRQYEGAVQGALNVIQAALPDFDAAGDARVINVGTNLVQNPVVPYHDYTAAKAGLLALTRTFAAELGPRGVRVNMVSGGLLRTTDASSSTPQEVFDAIAATTPLREVTTPAQFADAVLFFASAGARAVTGQNLMVDGGLVMN